MIGPRRRASAEGARWLLVLAAGAGGFVTGGPTGAALLATAVGSLAFRLDHGVALAAGIACLLATAAFTSAGRGAAAETMAVDAFGFLGVGVALGILRAFRNPDPRGESDGE